MLDELKLLMCKEQLESVRLLNICRGVIYADHVVALSYCLRCVGPVCQQ